MRRGCRIIRVQNRGIVFGLILKNPGFRGAVICQGVMAIEMVRSEIQKYADVRAERVDEFKLKAAQFGDRESIVARLIDTADQRRTDVSRKQCWKSRGLQNVSDERSCRGLSIRTG